MFNLGHLHAAQLVVRHQLHSLDQDILIKLQPEAIAVEIVYFLLVHFHYRFFITTQVFLYEIVVMLVEIGAIGDLLQMIFEVDLIILVDSVEIRKAVALCFVGRNDCDLMSGGYWLFRVYRRTRYSPSLG